MDRFRSLVRALLVVETLPQAPPAASPRDHALLRVVRWLVIPEPLPRDPPPPRRPPARLLRWLFAVEPLPPPDGPR